MYRIGSCIEPCRFIEKVTISLISENIKNNLSKVINDINLVEKAMEQLDNRETTTTYKLTKVKK